jgi:hypothetical protein
MGFGLPSHRVTKEENMSDTTTADLDQEFADLESRQTLLRLLALIRLLATCVIKSSYKVPTKLVDAIALTDKGVALRKKLTAKNVPYSEANLMCLLEYERIGKLIDVSRTNHADLINTISGQIASRDIEFPFTFGRDLYDRSYDLFDEDNAVLSTKETRELLDGLPQGIGHAFDLTVGPLGLLKSQERRYIWPTRRAPSYTCSALSCSVVHPRYLTSDQNAPINEHRERVRKLLEGERSDEVKWHRFVGKIMDDELSPFTDRMPEPVIYLIGDALDDQELKALTSKLLDGTGGSIRKIVQEVGLRGPADQITGPLDRSTLLQIIMLATDREIVSSLDHLVAIGTISIPHGETRVPIVNHGVAYGTFHLRAELSRFGTRTRSTTTNLAPLRTRRLIESMYRLDVEADREYLNWQLRDERGDSLESRLTHVLRYSDPNTMMTKLLHARHSNLVVASEQLGLPNLENTYPRDEERVKAVLWKLGYEVEQYDDPHASFWRHHESLIQATRLNPITTSSSKDEEIRGVTANYFVTLEGLLRESLGYLFWALTSDHYASQRPFVYSPESDEPESLRRLTQEASQLNSSMAEELRFHERADLYALMRGFQQISALLEDIESRRKSFTRRPGDLPPWSDLQDLQKFPWRHTVPFLDLSNDSQDVIHNELVEISRRLISAEVNDARNEWLHNRGEKAKIERLRSSLDAVADAVRRIQDGGFARQIFSRTRQETTTAGQREVILSRADGHEVAFIRPSSYDWLRLPALSRPQCVMLSARFADPDGLLRFTTRRDSPYARLWHDYPLRPASSRDEGFDVRRMENT